MAITTSVTNLDSDKIATVEDRLVQLLQEKFPNLDLNKGRVLRDILVRPAAILQAVLNEDLDILRRSMSLAEVDIDPTIADTDTVDNILSNFLLTRKTGTKTTGRVTLVVDLSVTTIVVSGTTFTATNGNIFVSDATFTGVTDSSLVLGSTDRLLVVRDDGKYTFTIEVTAASDGALQVDKDTRFVISPEPARLFDAYAESDFVTGTDVETNSALIARLRSGITVQAASGRAQIDALIRESFPNVRDVSIIGMGDPEMQRDAHNIFGLGQGGKADIYVRSETIPTRLTLEKDAVLDDASKQTWRLNFGKAEVPAFYRVESILLSSSAAGQLGSLTVESDTRGLDLTGTAFIPDIPVVNEGVYSAYQTATVIFTDPQTITTGMTAGVTTQKYSVVLAQMPNILGINDLILGRSVRNPQADYLVRASIPCFVGVEVVISRHPDDPTIDTSPIVSAVADSINSLTFSIGKISASELVDIVHNSLPARSFVQLPIHLWGTLRRPDGTTELLHSTSELMVTDEPLLSISSRTVSFYVRTADIDISVVTSLAKVV